MRVIAALCVILGGCRSRSASPGGSESMVSIPAIQGTGSASPLVGRIVTTGGIVTAVRRNGAGFWMQEPAGDGDEETSDAIQVWIGRDSSWTLPRVGDEVSVTGTVEEFARDGGLSKTQIGMVTAIEERARGQALPAPKVIERLPDVSIAEGMAFWSRLDAMLVAIDSARVVAPTNRFGELVVVVEANAVEGSGYDPEWSLLLLRSLGEGAVDYNPERVHIDDETRPTATARPGDRVESLIGVVDYSFGNYKIQASRLALHRNGPNRTPLPEVAGISVATFNVENLFDLEDEPGKDDKSSTPTAEALDVKLTKLALALVHELGAPAIVAVQEVENAAILTELALRVSSISPTEYRATASGSSDGRGIENAFLWDPARVELVESALLKGPAVEQAFGPESGSPGREPLLARFRIGSSASGELLVLGNHFKSKRGDDPLFGMKQPPERPTEQLRKRQARAVRHAVNEMMEDRPEALVLVAGDFNDFPFEEPGEGNDHPLAILEGSGDEVPFVNLLNGVSNAFTFLFEGNSQVMDHLLVSPALAKRVVDVQIAHFNAGEPEAIGSDPSRPERASDHDPVRVVFLWP